MSNRKNAYTEVYTILQDLKEEEYEKIPSEVIDAIKLNRNEEYEYKLDEELELKEQSMLPETKAILFILFRDYLATQEQKVKIIRMQNEERQKNELKKQKQYNTDVFANKHRQNIEQKKENKEKLTETDFVIYKENIFKRIINKIKGLFKRK